MSEIETQKILSLENNKELIKETVSDEILSRYYFKKGEYQNHIISNASILEAVKILHDSNKYREILENTND